MMHTLLLIGLWLSVASAAFPDGTNQQCADDAGPPWQDDSSVAYYIGFPNTPVLPANGQCPPPLKAACDKKGALAAHIDGPVDCNGKGWFCRITDQPGHRSPGHTSPSNFPDSNFARCNQRDTEHDRDGHCHGSDADSVYGWWTRDHWHRNYAGTLRCCCGWDTLRSAGLVNRCDYRKPVTPAEQKTCRDANEEHTVDMNPGCTEADRLSYKEPPAEQCWELRSFGPGPYDESPGFTQPPYSSPPASLPPTSPPSVEATSPPSAEGNDGDDGDATEPSTGNDDNDDDDEEEEASEFLLSEDFEASASLENAWLVEDSGSAQAPSKWRIISSDNDGKDGISFVEQTSNIRTREPHSRLEKLGTELVSRSSLRTSDLSFRARLRSNDNDMLGLAVRRRSAGDQLRLSIDAQKRKRSKAPTLRLVELVDMEPRLLASNSWRYKPGKTYDLEVQVVGDQCHVYLDGERVLEATVSPPNADAGTVALYSFANRGSAFTALRVTALSSLDAPTYQRSGAQAEENVPAMVGAEVGAGIPSLRMAEDEDEEREDVHKNPGGGADDSALTFGIVGAGVGACCLMLGLAAVLTYRRRRKKEANEEKVANGDEKSVAATMEPSASV